MLTSAESVTMTVPQIVKQTLHNYCDDYLILLLRYFEAQLELCLNLCK